MPAKQISRFWAFLPGVCLIAMGLTVLETVASLTFTPGEESRHVGDIGTILSSIKPIHPANKRYVQS
jgi:hypothetical protein